MLATRELSRGDLKVVNSWRASREMIDCLGAPYRFIDIEIDEAWYDAYLRNRDHTIRCVAVDSGAPDVALALATLSCIDWVHGTCEFHIMVGPDSQGKGVGAYALREMLRHAFSDLGLHRVELGVLSTNERARSLYEKAGFVCEGSKRSAVLKNGEYVDLVIMGLLRKEWRGSCAAANSVPGGGSKCD